jgi:hypothetical protein
MKRQDLERGSIHSIQKNAWGKPDVHRVDIGGSRFIVKDVRRKSLLYRWTLGLWAIHREWNVYNQLSGVRGIPGKAGRIDRFAFALEFVPGKAIERDEALPASFFTDLERLLRELHGRGVVHLDLRHKGNILASDKGEPFLLDFNWSFAFKKGGILHQTLFPLFRWVDYGGFLKLKQRASPASMTPEELKCLRRLNRIRRFWIFS